MPPAVANDGPVPPMFASAMPEDRATARHGVVAIVGIDVGMGHGVWLPSVPDPAPGTIMANTFGFDAFADSIVGGDQADTIYGGATTNATSTGRDTLYGGVETTAFVDTLYGLDGDDRLFSGATLSGSGDLLFGGDGSDTLNGGAGNETCSTAAPATTSPATPPSARGSPRP